MFVKNLNLSNISNNYKNSFHKILLYQSHDLLYITIDFDSNKNMIEINKMMVTIEGYYVVISMNKVMYSMEVLHEYILSMYYYHQMLM
jgi:hypothetical protein